MDFTTRLDILKNAGMLTEQDHGRICQVIDYFATEQGIGLTEENASSMITHLCAALGRIQRGEPVEPLDEEVYESTKEEPTFKQAYAITQELVARILPDLPEPEQKFLTMHIGVLLAAL